MKVFVWCIATLFLLTACQERKGDCRYFNQPPPGDTPTIFAPGIVSLPNRKEEVITFSPDGKAAFYSIEYYPAAGTSFILHAQCRNGVWSQPDSASFTRNRRTSEPFFANNGKRVYMFADKVLNQIGNLDICYSQQSGATWSDPVSLGSPPNALLPGDQYHPCIVGDGSLYFSAGTGEICRSQYKKGNYEPPVMLPYPINHANTSQTWGDPFVAPDESYMIFKSNRPGGYGGTDNYISFRKPDGTWTNPKNLGPLINSAYEETAGDITPDGQYMTFGRNGDLYWVSAGFIDSLRETNFTPYLQHSLKEQVATKGLSFSYRVPEYTFVDDDGSDILSLDAKLENGNPLPVWLNFEARSKTFSGIPTQAVVLPVRVTATDAAGASIAVTFTISVQESQNP
jgi:hypothetical protein